VNSSASRSHARSSTVPKILFADEPTGNLDAETSSGIIDIMLELNRSAGTALVLVTHDADVAKLTQRTIRLRSGEMVENNAA
jgi:putative ABC transport system ATP-binding protein